MAEAALAPRVLVADDVELMRELLALQLGRAGYRWLAVEDGAAALAALRAGDVALVLMDRAMPGMDGCAATAAWRAEEGAVRVPIVGLGARIDDSAACLAAGMDDFVCKPLTIASLAALLAQHAPWSGR